MSSNQYFPQSIPHPGRTLAEKLEEMGMGPKEFAIRTAKPEKTIIAVLKGESSITSDMAIQFENVTKIPANYWINHQKSYDEYRARQRQMESLEASSDWARQFPYAAMVKLGWIPKQTRAQDKAAELLSFFSLANHKAWEDYYLHQQLKVAFRISLASTSQPHPISAWLRMGEIQATDITAKPYSERAFKAALPSIKAIMAQHPADFFQQLQWICAEVGVKVVHTPCLPKAPLNGSARWVNETPLIQLTGRHKRNDIFWFTFFHEAGHILLHGKKDIFLEEVDYSDKDARKEQEADDFAISWTLTMEQEEEIMAAVSLDESLIPLFAQRFNTHPAIIVGRLQRRGRVTYAFGKQFFETLLW